MDENNNGTPNPGANPETQAQPQQSAQPVQQTSAVATVPQQPKETLGQKAKKHWKAIVGTVLAVGAAVGSAAFAHKKGVQAGMMMGMQQPNEDDGSYSPLDPNM